jgi:hypothetical protein
MVTRQGRTTSPAQYTVHRCKGWADIEKNSSRYARDVLMKRKHQQKPEYIKIYVIHRQFMHKYEISTHLHSISM